VVVAERQQRSVVTLQLLPISSIFLVTREGDV
jgi:hypothetical protein